MRDGKLGAQRRAAAVVSKGSGETTFKCFLAAGAPKVKVKGMCFNSLLRVILLLQNNSLIPFHHGGGGTLEPTLCSK